MEVSGKRFLIVGMARSGIAAAKFLATHGAEVVVSDIKNEYELLDSLLGLAGLPVTKVFGTHPNVEEIAPDWLVVSPGVPLEIPPIKKARKLGIPVIGELELAYRFASSPFVAITGTNGKTTTTSLIGQIYQDAGWPTLVGGNIGQPLINSVENLSRNGVIVAEVSSFQLETIKHFKPKVAVMLNLTPDHLDRHGSFAGYIAAKGKIFSNQDQTDFAVINYDDPEVKRFGDRVNGQVIYFSQQSELETGVFVKQGKIIARLEGKEEFVCQTEDIFIKGKHNLENSLAATAAALVLGVPAQSIGKTLKEFQGVVHRLEFVTEINGVAYINDSKGTNPDAAIKALDAYDRPIVLIAGGKNKGCDFTEFAFKVKEKVKTMVLVGQAAPAIAEAVTKAGFTTFHHVKTFEDAVRKAAKLAVPGDIVLLSPACTSWDMFNNFEERGDLFKKLVWEMKR